MQEIDGFVNEPAKTAAGKTYRGRLALEAVQWTGTGSDRMATFTFTADQVADAVFNGLVWTDQSVQRGIKPTAPSDTAKVLSVADGYPAGALYIFNHDNADEMVEKLLEGQRLFLNPLVWNLRPGNFSAFWHEEDAEIFLYDGRVFLPDSHHRHQSIAKAVKAVRENPRSYPKFDLGMQFKVELYFLDQEDEGNYFFDKNQRPRPTAKSKAYDLTTQDDLSVLAKRVIAKSPNLQGGVNRVTDRLSNKADHFVTLSTLREMMRTFAEVDEVEDSEMDGLAVVASEFLDLLSELRPELRTGTSAQDRNRTLAAAGVMMHGYAALMRDFALDVAEHGLAHSKNLWRERLNTLSPGATVQVDDWEGDMMSKSNPLWEQVGIVKISKSTGRLTVSNTGGTRARAGRVLRRFVSRDFKELSDLGGV